jgi:thioredoxin 1
MNKILAFTATWCGPCKRMKPVLEEFDSNQVTIYDVETTEGKEAIETYGVRGVPTFIFVDEEGGELSRVVGATTKEVLEEHLNV